jgi:Uma2 family endonuclease
MMRTSVSAQEYLATAYHPDVDYIDDRVEQRNVGEKEHGKLQFRIAYLLKRSRLPAFIETRLKISATRYRVPDVCAYHQEPDESIFTHPPLLCVEILSPEDRMSRSLTVVQDYLSIGVPVVWLLDQLEKRAYVADPATGIREVAHEISADEERITFPLSEIFSDEDLF